MKKMLVAVFGHYDSRGGTTAIPLTHATSEAVREAMRKYDSDCFGIEEEEDEIKTTAYGMEARECDKAVHSLLHGYTRPSEDDFLYVAELHYPDRANLEGDLEERDEEGWYRRVLADAFGDEKGGDEDEARPYPGLHRWADLKVTHTTQMVGDEAYTSVIPDNDSIIEHSLKAPVQLELVRYRANKKLEEEYVRLTAEMLVVRDGLEARGEKTWWRDETYSNLENARGEVWDKKTKDLRKKALRAAKVLVNPSTCRWDDDAYGFVIGITWTSPVTTS